MNNTLNNKIDAALQSLDGIATATPNPYLLTRVHAALAQQEKPNVWMHIASFLTKPAVAFSAITLVIGLNVFIIGTKFYNTENDAVAKRVNNTKYDFAINDVSVMYSTENIEP